MCVLLKKHQLAVMQGLQTLSENSVCAVEHEWFQCRACTPHGVWPDHGGYTDKHLLQ